MCCTQCSAIRACRGRRMADQIILKSIHAGTNRVLRGEAGADASCMMPHGPQAAPCRVNNACELTGHPTRTNCTIQLQPLNLYAHLRCVSSSTNASRSTYLRLADAIHSRTRLRVVTLSPTRETESDRTRLHDDSIMLDSEERGIPKSYTRIHHVGAIMSEQAVRTCAALQYMIHHGVYRAEKNRFLRHWGNDVNVNVNVPP